MIQNLASGVNGRTPTSTGVVDFGPDGLAPFAPDAEEAVLGCILIDPQAYGDVAPLLKPDDFYLHKHRWIWDSIVHLKDQGISVDPLTLANELERRNKFNEVGGTAFLARLLISVPSSLHIESYARIISDKAARRSMMGMANDIAKLAMAKDRDITELMGDAQAIVAHVSEHRLSVFKPRQRFTVHSISEALILPPEQIKWRIDQLFPDGSVSIVFGEGGTAKTYGLIDAAICVAMGIAWLEFTTAQGAVLIVDEESGLRRLNRRLSEVARGHMCDDVTLPVHYTSLEQLNLTNQADVASLEALIVETGARLVIIDALADVLMGGDDNLVGDIQPIFMDLRGIAERQQAAIVVIDHANKLGDYRGSTAKRGATDIMIQVEKNRSSPDMTFTVIKARDVDEFTFAARANFGEGEFYLSPATVSKEKPMGKAEKFVIEYLTEHGDSALEDIMAAADSCSPQSARQAIYKLSAAKKIKRTNPGQRGVSANYNLVSKLP